MRLLWRKVGEKERGDCMREARIKGKRPLGGSFVGLRAGVSGKYGIWRTKPPDAESAVGAESPKVWANARTYPLHTVLGRFGHQILDLCIDNCRS